MIRISHPVVDMGCILHHHHPPQIQGHPSLGLIFYHLYYCFQVYCFGSIILYLILYSTPIPIVHFCFPLLTHLHLNGLLQIELDFNVLFQSLVLCSGHMVFIPCRNPTLPIVVDLFSVFLSSRRSQILQT